MLIRKIQKGMYEIIDDCDNEYLVEDSRVTLARNLPSDADSRQGDWGVWDTEPSEGPRLLINDKTFKDCLFAISLWEEAEEV